MMPMSAKPDGATLLAMAKKRRYAGWIWRGVGLVVLVALGVVGYRYKWGKTAAKVMEYQTKPAKLMDLRRTVTATGTLKGVDSVEVGAQVSGRVARVLVKFNDRVKQGQVLAEIDPDQLASRVDQSKAQVQAADASLRLAKATAAQAKAQHARVAELNRKGLASDKDLEAAAADAERAEASVASAQAQATLARASLKDAKTSLSYSTIVAPIDGIVLDRAVEPGQTVAASLQAPVLFTLARDLTQLELRVDVDEADVGGVKEGQKATFVVDAWPDKKFQSEVLSVRNLPTAGQTVVTYQAVLSVDNDELLLRPGMTATATITTSETKGTLVVANAGLRFTPPATASSGAGKSGGGSIPFLGGMPGRPPGDRRSAPADSAAVPAGGSKGVVWLLQDGRPQRVLVETGGTDGEWTAVKPGTAVAAGSLVIVDAQEKKQP